MHALAQTRTLLAEVGREHDWVDQTYAEVRDGLFGAVGAVHVPWRQIPRDVFDQVATYIDSVRSVYTLNYDLILYWARNAAQVCAGDFFWGDGGTFDITDVQLWGRRTGVYNLHGGLHLWRDTHTGATGKLVGDSGNLLEVLTTIYSSTGSRQPLFVSEGSAEDKIRTIRQSDYLSFAYRALVEDTSPTVIFGSSLGTSDSHIVAAIAEGRSKLIAVSAVRGSQSSDEVIEWKARVRRLFQGHSVCFFNASTHPLGSPSLRVGGDSVV